MKDWKNKVIKRQVWFDCKLLRPLLLLRLWIRKWKDPNEIFPSCPRWYAKTTALSKRERQTFACLTWDRSYTEKIRRAEEKRQSRAQSGFHTRRKENHYGFQTSKGHAARKPVVECNWEERCECNCCKKSCGSTRKTCQEVQSDKPGDRQHIAISK